MNCYQEMKAAFVVILLRDTAYEWYLLYKKQNGNPNDWKELTQELTGEFGANSRGQEA